MNTVCRNKTLETKGDGCGGHKLTHFSPLIALNQACFIPMKGEAKCLLLLFLSACTCSEPIDLPAPLGPNLSLKDSAMKGRK